MEGDELGWGVAGVTSGSWKVHLQGSHRKHVLEAGVMKCVVSRSLGEEGDKRLQWTPNSSRNAIIPRAGNAKSPAESF